MKAQQQSETRRRTTRLIGAGVIVALLLASLTGLFARGAAADPTLPPLTPTELLNRVATAQVDGMSATFTQRSDLGLPALPSGIGGGDELQSALTLLTGTHTIRVWTAGPQHSRVSLVDDDSESSVIRNGNQVWTWSSEQQKAGHATIDAKTPTARPTGAPSTPAEAIDRLLKAIGPSTEVTASGTGYVAGRPVYQLILAPKDAASLIGQVRLFVDATTFVPLGLRVLDRGGAEAVSLLASTVDFSVPAAGVFEFTPPAGVEVTELDAKASDHPTGTAKSRPETKTVGTGWTTVLVASTGTTEVTDATAKALLDSLPAVSGAWGRGRLLSTSLVNVVLTDDGRVAVGAVTEDRLYAALAR